MAPISVNARVRRWQVAMVLAVFSVAVVAQQRAVQPTTDTEHLDAAREVRALRTELKQAASTIVAAQAVVGRLQLIDRRMSFLAGQLADVRRELAVQEGKREQPQKALKFAEDGMAAGATGFDYAIAQARSALADVERAERVLRAREAQLDGQMRSEEQRWAVLTARLDQLEAGGTR